MKKLLLSLITALIFAVFFINANAATYTVNQADGVRVIDISSSMRILLAADFRTRTAAIELASSGDRDPNILTLYKREVFRMVECGAIYVTKGDRILMCLRCVGKISVGTTRPPTDIQSLVREPDRLTEWSVENE